MRPALRASILPSLLAALALCAALLHAIPCRAADADADTDADADAAKCRITSYNVCYTKLLRGLVRPPGGFQGRRQVAQRAWRVWSQPQSTLV